MNKQEIKELLAIRQKKAKVWLDNGNLTIQSYRELLEWGENIAKDEITQ